MEEIKSQVVNTNLNPHQIYKNTQNAKNKKQISNQKFLCNKNSRFPMDEVNNCILMSIVESFPQLIVHGPDVRIMACDFDLYIEARKSIQRAKFRVMFVYDTTFNLITFNLTGLYVSFLTFSSSSSSSTNIL